MGGFLQLTSRDEHLFDAFKATPFSIPRGDVCVIQEIFGVNSHIREVDQIRRDQSQTETQLIRTDHGFNSGHCRQYDAECYEVSRVKILAFIAIHIG